MHYVIYPDTLFLENLVCNLLFLAFFKKLFFPAAKWKRIGIAAGITAMSNTLVSILFFHSIWILKLGVLFPAACLMIFYVLDVRECSRILEMSYRMILWILVFGGVFQTISQWGKVKGSTVMILTGVLTVFLGITEKLFGQYRRQRQHLRETILYYHRTCIRVQGFLDTGNQLLDPYSQKPVSVLSKEAWEKLSEKEKEIFFRLIPYRTVGNPDALIRAVEIDRMILLEGKRRYVIEKPVIAIAEQPFQGIFHYSILLHNEYF